MSRFSCVVCDYIYDEAAGDSAQGSQPGTKLEEIPEGWLCPDFGVGKDQFEAE